MNFEAGASVRVRATEFSNQTIAELDGEIGEVIETQVWSPVATAVHVRFAGDRSVWIYADNLQPADGE